MADRQQPQPQQQPQDKGRQSQDNAKGGEQTKPSHWEWALGAVGLLLLLATLGYFVQQALTTPADAPVPVAQVLGVEPQEQGFLVRLRVSNQGTETAASLKVAGTLKRGDEVVEESETEFQYLPGGSWREGGIFFTHDPAQFALEVGPKGYELP